MASAARCDLLGVGGLVVAEEAVDPAGDVLEQEIGAAKPGDGDGRPAPMIQLIGTPAIQKAAPKATVISTVWPTSGSSSSRTTARP